MRRSKLPLLVFAFVTFPLMAQTRMIPHLTAAGGSFTTQIILANQSGGAASYSFVGYDLSGNVVAEDGGTINGSSTLYQEATAFFGISTVSHFSFEGPDHLTLSVSYQANTAGSGPAHANAANMVSKVWRLYAGNPEVTWDGMAVVNRGDGAARITVRHVAESGQILGSATVAESLPSNGKTLSVLSAIFGEASNSYFEIISDNEIAVLALRGNQSSDFIWQNSAVPVTFEEAGQISWAVESAFPNLFFNGLIGLSHPPEDDSFLYAIIRGGTVDAFANDTGTNSKTTILDISDQVSTSGEMGLLGLAFHPNFAENGLIFVNYATSVGSMRSVISRFQTDGGTPAIVDPDSELVLMEVPQPFDNHNGGHLAFGPDGYLYIGLGDGGSGGDPQNNAQDNTNLLGTMVRIDVDNPSNGLSYSIPSDNPFVGGNGEREEIYAYGLRNPWRYEFDTYAGRSDLWVADVGQAEIEEIDLLSSGGNFGWRIMEGTQCFNPSTGCDTQGLELPIFEYDHSNDDRSITGGSVYRGIKHSALFGHYIYGDFVSGRLWALDVRDPSAPENKLLVEWNGSPVSFATDLKGEIYVCHIGGSVGKIVRN